MKEIHLKLHNENNVSCMLESQDIYDYVGEEKAEDIELALYIDKWCEYLNWYVGGMHNTEMKFSDSEYLILQGWIDGYNFAKKYDVSKKDNCIKIKTKKYLIILDIPFDI